MPIKKVLVVDDSPTQRYALSQMLSKAGFEVITAENGDEAIVKTKLELPDLVLMDIVMPKDGYQATRRIVRDESTKHIPVILCTSKSGETDKIWGLHQGAKDYIVKPVNRKELFAKISKLGWEPPQTELSSGESQMESQISIESQSTVVGTQSAAGSNVLS